MGFNFGGIGSVLGGIGGFLIGGPAGAAIGASLGGAIGDTVSDTAAGSEEEKGIREAQGILRSDKESAIQAIVDAVASATDTMTEEGLFSLRILNEAKEFALDASSEGTRNALQALDRSGRVSSAQLIESIYGTSGANITTGLQPGTDSDTDAGTEDRRILGFADPTEAEGRAADSIAAALEQRAAAIENAVVHATANDRADATQQARLEIMREERFDPSLTEEERGTRFDQKLEERMRQKLTEIIGPRIPQVDEESIRAEYAVEPQGGALAELEEVTATAVATMEDREVKAEAAIKEASERAQRQLTEDEEAAIKSDITDEIKADQKLTDAQATAFDSLIKASDEAKGEITRSELLAITAEATGLDKALKLQFGSLKAGLAALEDELAAGEEGLRLLSERATEEEILNSPIFRRRLEEGEKAVKRRFAQIGLPGSGAEAEAIRRLNQDLTAEETQAENDRRFRRGSELSRIGLEASQTSAGLNARAGEFGADLTSRSFSTRAGIRERAGQLRSNIDIGRGTAEAGVAQNIGLARGSLASDSAARRLDTKQSFASQRGSIEQHQGDLLTTLAQNMASLIGGTEANLGIQQANLIAQLGANLANVAQTTGTKEAALLEQEGTQRGRIAEYAATGRSNVSTNFANQLGNIIFAGGTNTARAITGLAPAQANLAVQESGVRAGTISSVGNTFSDLATSLFSSGGTSAVSASGPSAFAAPLSPPSNVPFMV